MILLLEDLFQPGLRPQGVCPSVPTWGVCSVYYDTMQSNRIQSVLLSVTLSIFVMVMIGVLAGCERADQTDPDSPVDRPPGNGQPLSQVAEFDDFTLRVSVSRTELLPDAMAIKYAIKPAPDLVLINLVIVENRLDPQRVTVPADVSVQYESRIGREEVINMRAIQAAGDISYIGTFDSSAQRVFELDIEALPAGSDEPLHMSFEVYLDTL